MKSKEDSEDIVQTVFSKIYTMPKDKLPLETISSWIYSVTKIDNDKVEQNTSEDREESKSQDIEEDANEELKDITNNIEESETKQETLIPDSNSKTNINYYGIGILSISVIFLIIAIIFSIFLVKYQLNLKKKTSK